MRTISLCVMRLPICNFSVLLPIRIRGLPVCIRGPVSDVALTRQRSTAESRVNQNFLVASAHTTHQHQKTGIEVTPMSFILELRRRVALSTLAFVACRCCPPCQLLPSPARPRPPSPSRPRWPRPRPRTLVRPRLCPPRPSPPPLTTTAIAAVDDDHHRRCGTFEDDDRQKPEVVVHHRRRRQWRSLLNAAAVDGCGGNGVFAAAVNDDDRRRWLHPTAASVNNDHSGRRRPLPLPTLTTMTAIADRHRCCERHRE